MYIYIYIYVNIYIYIYIYICIREVTIETAETGADDKEHIRVGKMNMVDLLFSFHYYS